MDESQLKTIAEINACYSDSSGSEHRINHTHSILISTWYSTDCVSLFPSTWDHKCFKIIWDFFRLLKHTGLTCTGPLICGFFQPDVGGKYSICGM